MTPERAEQFWSMVEKIPFVECWVWTGRISPQGYGYFSRGVRAHRAAYEEVRGAIPSGLTIDHLCRNRWCVNPAHLEAVSVKVNTLRGEGRAAKNARKTHCRSGHALVQGNLVDWHLKRGMRRCSICKKESLRATKRRARMEAK